LHRKGAPTYVAWQIDGVEVRHEAGDVAEAFEQNAAARMQIQAPRAQNNAGCSIGVSGEGRTDWVLLAGIAILTSRWRRVWRL
jgi:hypothetical protein